MAQIIALLGSLEELLGVGEFGINRLGLYMCEPGWSWRPPVFTDLDLWLVFEGEGQMRINGREYQLQPGAGFLLQPGDQVEATHKPDKPLTVFACHIDPPGHDSHGRRLSEQVLRFQVRNPDYLRALAEQALHLGQRKKHSAILAKLLVAQMIVHALAPEEEADSPSAIQQLTLEIRARPAYPWSTPRMARRCALSTPQFNRQFRQLNAMSPRQFVIQQRVRRATQLLRESDMTIQQIAQSLGYNDHFFFHRQFRKITGKTPGEIRDGAHLHIDR